MTRHVARFEEIVAGTALAVVFLAVVWGVIARYLAPQPAAWSNELATMGFAWVVFIGAAAGARRRLHVGIDLVTALLPGPVQRGLSVVVAAGLAAALCYVAGLAVWLGYLNLDRPSPVMRLPMTIVHASAALGFASMALQSAGDAARMLRGRDV